MVPTMPTVVPTTIEDQGLRFFFTRFVSAVTGMTGDVPSGLDSSPFLKAILMQLALRDATISVGLAAMSNVSQDRAFLLAARRSMWRQSTWYERRSRIQNWQMPTKRSRHHHANGMRDMSPGPPAGLRCASPVPFRLHT